METGMSLATLRAESKETVRRPIAKVRITWTDPLIDLSIQTTTTGDNRVSYPTQVADLVTDVPKKWFSTNSGPVTNADFFPMPSTLQEARRWQVGWWGSTNSLPDWPADGDGNLYATVVIGTQEWTVENWKSTKYADGSPIPNVVDGTEWDGLSTPAYCWYDNTEAGSYGALYNWFVVDPLNTKSIAPPGWRVPTEADFVALNNYLGDGVAGGKMKTEGASDWSAPNTGATNESGFDSRGSGERFSGAFNNYKLSCYYLTQDLESGSAILYSNFYNSEALSRWVYSKTMGNPLRIVRDI
jgi:uncharacterized protein (TIGR02145 family)